ncbi:MAG: immunoglobulin domain-containing protein [Phycisphaerales bacterium]|nr:MAG: immunoglobulin domain-containing protein [Phycisphaerales bacterium]
MNMNSGTDAPQARGVLVSRIGLLAAMALSTLAVPAMGQVARRGVPTFATNQHKETSTLYATQEKISIDTEDRWRPMCGTPAGALTEEDLHRIARDHERQMGEVQNLLVVDNTIGGVPRGGINSRAAGLNVIFNINATGAPSGAAASFAAAEAYIESQWSDPISITVSVSWANLGGSVIGATGSNYVTNISYTNVRNGLINGMDGNDTIQSFLPTGSSFPVRFNATSATVTNQTSMDWTRANYRATIGSVTNSDASMQYNSAFSFDFDPTNGVGGSLLSLVDTIVHEVGHAQGFTSNADGGTRPEALDLFRFARVDRAGLGDTNPDTTAEFQTAAREIDFNNPTNDDANSDLISAEYRMSDGSPNQASHFFQQSFSPPSAIGIMQPILSTGVTFSPNFYKTADKDMLDAIGWDDAGAACNVPTISTQPVGGTGCTGTSFGFTVAATGTGTLTYQWRRNGVDISGATGTTYTIASVVLTSGAFYDCVVTNDCGSTTSNPAQLTVVPSAEVVTQPQPVLTCLGSPATFSITWNGDSPTFQWRRNGVAISGATSDSYTIASVVPASAAFYDCVLTDTCGNVTSNPALLTILGSASFTSQPSPATVCPGSPATFTVAVSGNTPAFQWRKNGTNIGGATSNSYTIASVIAGDAGSYDCVVTDTCNTITSNAASLGVNTQVSVTGQPNPVTTCPGSPATFTVAASGTAPTFQWRKNGINIGGATSNSYTIASVVAGDAGNYDCVVTGACNIVNSNQASLTVSAPASVTSDPSPVSACVGSIASFVVVVSGDSPTFQWRKDGTPIGGATSNTYSIAAVALADAGNYDCVVTNACGSDTSVAAALTVGEGVSITADPQPATACTGMLASFSVSYSGSGATFQWRKDLSNISGANADTYTIAAVAPADAGNYDCVVTNACGTATSAAAALTVQTCCVADVDDGSGTGTPDGGVTVDDLLYYLTQFNAGSLVADVDDGSATGTPDGGVTVDDLLYYLTRFNAGC